MVIFYGSHNFVTILFKPVNRGFEIYGTMADLGFSCISFFLSFENCGHFRQHYLVRIFILLNFNTDIKPIYRYTKRRWSEPSN